MVLYRADLRDIYFNLFDFLKIPKLYPQFNEQDITSIIEEFNKFMSQEVWPTRESGDQEGVHISNGIVTVPKCFHELNQKFCENGWFKIGYPEEIGGVFAPYAVSLACTSLLNGANASYSIFVELTHGAMNIILKFGTKQMQQQWIPSMMEGHIGGTMCLTEPGAGSDVGALKTMATPMSDGRYKIKGTKLFISAGDNDLYKNIVHLVLAKTPGAPEGTKGISLFAVPKLNADGSSNDVLCNKIEEKMGIHGSPTCELVFGGNDNCLGEMVGKECEGMGLMFVMMNEVRLFCGIQGESQANMAFMLSEAYARERIQFGKPIIDLPDVKRMLLKMRAKARGLRALNLYVGSLFDRKCLGESTDGLIALLTPISKAYSTDEGFNVCVEAMQVHGGYGYIKDYAVEQFVRDSKIATIYEGTNGIQAMDFLTRKVLKDQSKTLQELFMKIHASIKKAQPYGWNKELTLLTLSMSKTKDILNYYEEKSTTNMEAVLGTSVDFLNYISRIVVAWLLLEQAILAKEKMMIEKDGDGYLASKITDYLFYSHQDLAHNAGLYQTICVFREDYQHISV